MNKNNLKEQFFVANLIENITKEDLNNIFLTFGLIKSIELPIDYKTGLIIIIVTLIIKKKGKIRGFAYIEYEEIDDAM